MSHIIIGAYAHVDGGKTTLSEAILHKCAVLRSFGRVDHEDSFLDYNSYERRKGITVFTKEARFSYKDKDYVYVDTPGHLDFVGEVNRSFEILDAAIVIIDASSPLPADTISRFRYLKTLRIPVLLFLNKMDIAHRSLEELIKDLSKDLDEAIVSYEDIQEASALNHEEILDAYLQDNEIEDSYIIEDLKEGLLFPVFAGSALHEEGIDPLLDFIDRYIDMPKDNGRFKAYIYKVDDYARLKIFSGTLKTRDVFERDVDLLFVSEFTSRFPDIEDTASGSSGTTAHVPAHAAEHPNPHQDKEYREYQPLQDVSPGAALVLDHDLHLV